MSAVSKTAQKSAVKAAQPAKEARESAHVLISHEVDVDGVTSVAGPVHEVGSLTRMRAICGVRLFGWSTIERAELAGLERCSDCAAAT